MTTYPIKSLNQTNVGRRRFKHLGAEISNSPVPSSSSSSSSSDKLINRTGPTTATTERWTNSSGKWTPPLFSPCTKQRERKRSIRLIVLPLPQRRYCCCCREVPVLCRSRPSDSSSTAYTTHNNVCIPVGYKTDCQFKQRSSKYQAKWAAYKYLERAVDAAKSAIKRRRRRRGAVSRKFNSRILLLLLPSRDLVGVQQTNKKWLFFLFQLANSRSKLIPPQA